MENIPIGRTVIYTKAGKERIRALQEREKAPTPPVAHFLKSPDNSTSDDYAAARIDIRSCQAFVW